MDRSRPRPQPPRRYKCPTTVSALPSVSQSVSHSLARSFGRSNAHTTTTTTTTSTTIDWPVVGANDNNYSSTKIRELGSHNREAITFSLELSCRALAKGSRIFSNRKITIAMKIHIQRTFFERVAASSCMVKSPFEETGRKEIICR